MDMSSGISLVAPSPLKRIGYGHCGSVWATLSSAEEPGPIVIKREDASPGRDIKNEVSVQSRVCTALKDCSRVLIPRCFGFLDQGDERWEGILPLLPRGSQPCRAMVSEKIEPVSVESQRLLVKRYAPEKGQIALLEALLEDGQREHCLVRIYLGRRRQMFQPSQQSERRSPRFFSLRNFPLHVDQAEDLGLPCEEYARAMAEAMAMLHWKVGTDAADVEFVLGMGRGQQAEMAAETNLGQHALWLLDFDCCRPVKEASADEPWPGLESMARAFWRNDPYFPQPGGVCASDQRLWDIFAQEYQRVGVEIVRSAPPRKAKSAQEMCALVRDTIAHIEETKDRWRFG